MPEGTPKMPVLSEQAGAGAAVYQALSPRTVLARDRIHSLSFNKGARQSRVKIQEALGSA